MPKLGMEPIRRAALVKAAITEIDLSRDARRFGEQTRETRMVNRRWKIAQREENIWIY